jgi:hypothetical protein
VNVTVFGSHTTGAFGEGGGEDATAGGGAGTGTVVALADATGVVVFGGSSQPEATTAVHRSARRRGVRMIAREV